MVTENGKIIEISESELFSLWLERGIDDIMSFPDYKTRFVAAGCIVHDDLEAADQERCGHDFAYDELRGQIVCKKCFHVLTAEEKRAALEHANALRRAEEETEAADACPLTGCGGDHS